MKAYSRPIKYAVSTLISLVILYFSYFECKKLFLPKVLWQKEEGAIRIGGSQTIAKAMGAAIDEYQKANFEKFDIRVNGQSSGSGIKDLIEGRLDLARSSRPLKEEELRDAVHQQRPVRMVQVGYDCIAVVTSRAISRDLKDLTLEQLRKIFYTGEISDWSQLGVSFRSGSKGKIPVIIRSEAGASGTLDVFGEVVLASDKKHRSLSSNRFVPGAITFENLEEFLEALQQRDHFISFVSSREANSKIIPLGIKTPLGVKRCVYPDILSGDYPLSRGIYLVAPVFHLGGSADFISYVLSKEGQDRLKQNGFIPVRDTQWTPTLQPEGTRDER